MAGISPKIIVRAIMTFEELLKLSERQNRVKKKGSVILPCDPSITQKQDFDKTNRKQSHVGSSTAQAGVTEDT